MRAASTALSHNRRLTFGATTCATEIGTQRGGPAGVPSWPVAWGSRCDGERSRAAPLVQATRACREPRRRGATTTVTTP